MSIEHSIVHLLNRIGSSQPKPPPAGLDLGRDTESHQVVAWPHTERTRHLCCIGKTGSGKTHLLLYLATQLARRGEPFVFIDYHGDATRDLVSLLAGNPEAAQRLVLLDPTDPATSPGLNPLELDDADDTGHARSSELAAILRQRWRVDAFGARTDELLRNTLFVLSTTGQTLVEAPLFLTSKDFRAHLLERVANPDARDYWLTRFEPLSEAMKASFREPLLNKITSFISEPACRHFLGQSSTFTFTKAADDGSFVIINLSKGRLREHAHTLGNLIFAKLQFEILARSIRRPEDRPLLTIFADEAQNLAENDLAILLTEGRKFRASLITGQQHWEQTPSTLRGALLSAGTHVFFNLSASDAWTLSSELSASHRQRYVTELSSLGRGEAIVRAGANRPYRVRVPALPLSTASTSDVERLRSLSVSRYGRSRRAIEEAIAARRRLPKPYRFGPPTQIRHADDEGQQGW